MLNQQPSHRINRMNLHYTDPFLSKQMSEVIFNWLPVTGQRELIILCMGTDRSTGDSLGPLVGSFIHDLSLHNFKTYGWLHEPVHAMNLKDCLKYIYNQYTSPFIITIDAGLGRERSIGHIISGVGSIKPGAALNKNLPAIGHIHLVGIVNLHKNMEYSVLQSTRLSLVMDMAKKIANILYHIDQKIDKH